MLDKKSEIRDKDKKEKIGMKPFFFVLIVLHDVNFADCSFCPTASPLACTD